MNPFKDFELDIVKVTAMPGNSTREPQDPTTTSGSGSDITDSATVSIGCTDTCVFCDDTVSFTCYCGVLSAEYCETMDGRCE